MFDIVWIELKNFKSFYGTHEFEFPDTPGLYLLTGKNLVQKRLGANGAGKTSLLDAVYWALYGHTPGGLRAGDIRSWGVTNECYVQLAIDVGKHQFVITRTQTPNSLTLENDAGESQLITQEDLIDKILLDYTSFLHSAMTAQLPEAMFFDLKPTMKLNIFSQIMNLDFWLDRSDHAKHEASKIESLIQEKNEAINYMKGERKVLSKSLDDLEVEGDEFEVNRKEKLKSLKKEVKQSSTSTDWQLHKLEILLASRDDLGLSHKKLHKQGEKLSAESAKLYNSKSEVDGEITFLQRRIEYIKESISQFKNLQGKCPVCKQEISVSHKNKEINNLQEKIKDVEITINEKCELVDALVLKSTKKNAEEKKAKRERDKLLASYQRMQIDVVKVKSDVNLKEQALSELKQRLKEAKNEENPYYVLFDKLLTKFEKIEKKLKTEKRSILKITETLGMIKYWVSGFKQIRLFVVEEALHQLELEVNNNLIQLGLTNWRIEFDIERETKSGGVIMGFTVLIHVPENDQPVKWEAWSGGEKQRLRLAGTLGISNLIMDRLGLHQRVEFYDELSKSLSIEGIEDMLDTLQERAELTKRKIWIVDHQAIDYGNFSGVLTVTKDKDGSHLNYAKMDEGE